MPVIKLTEDEVRAIHLAARRGYPLRQIAERYGVTKSTVHRIKEQASWQKLWDEEQI